MKTASSTTSTRAMPRSRSFRLGIWGPVEQALDPDRPAASVGDHEPAEGQGPAVDVDVDEVLRLAVELDDGARRHPDGPGHRHARAAELGGDTHRGIGQRGGD